MLKTRCDGCSKMSSDDCPKCLLDTSGTDLTLVVTALNCGPCINLKTYFNWTTDEDKTEGLRQHISNNGTTVVCVSVPTFRTAVDINELLGTTGLPDVTSYPSVYERQAKSWKKSDPSSLKQKWG